ncbi:MAG: ABC transporter ATP-binding protein [Anaerolineae bacterium]|jgi:ABC-2 type transport system ATP-binding protein
MDPSPDELGNGPREVMIDVQHLSRFYGEVPALVDVTFRAHRGEIVGFLGPNGAGKTTTMRIITGYMPPSSGTVSVAGFDVVEESMEARGLIGYLPENTPLYTDMTVYGYLDYMAKLRGVDDRGAAIDRVMARVGIDDRADDLIGQLSKGLRQRVGIAQALVHDPEVIILDEPTIGLDPHQIREVRGLIRELGGEHTIILSTHILSEAEQLCDRVLIINDGEIVAEDALERLAEQTSKGGERMTLRVGPGTSETEVAAALAGTDGVAATEPLGDGRYLVTTEPGAFKRAEISAMVVGRGWALLELTPIETTLEDIFIQVTQAHLTGAHHEDDEGAFPEAADEGPGDGGSDDDVTIADVAREAVTGEAREEGSDA